MALTLAAISLNWRSGILVLAAIAALCALAASSIPADLWWRRALCVCLFLFAVGMALWAAGVN
jgi:hypothetical protein